MGLFNWFAKRAAHKAFAMCDSNGDGRLDIAEVEVAVLKMHNIVNKRLPSWQDPPSSAQIKAAFKIFDIDGNGSLDVLEFYEFSRSMVKTGPDVFFARLGRSALVDTIVLPGASVGIKKFAGPALGLSNVPHAVFAPLLGIVGKSIRGIFSW